MHNLFGLVYMIFLGKEFRPDKYQRQYRREEITSKNRIVQGRIDYWSLTFMHPKPEDYTSSYMFSVDRIIDEEKVTNKLSEGFDCPVALRRIRFMRTMFYEKHTYKVTLKKAKTWVEIEEVTDWAVPV